MRRRYLLTGLYLVAANRAALWCLPWRKVERLAGRLPLRAPRGGASPAALAAAVTRAARLVPHASCLTQALALRRLLERCGHPCTLHIGVAAGTPFRAHAWVQTGATVLLSEPEEIRAYVPLLTLPS